MYDALNKLYDSKNAGRKLSQKNPLRNVLMGKSESIYDYLLKVYKIKDQLAAIGDVIYDAELVTTTLNGYPLLGTLLSKGSVLGRRSYQSF
jgi:hypothetical protein